MKYMEDIHKRLGMKDGGLREKKVLGGIVKFISKAARKYTGKGDIHTPEFRKYIREKLKKEYPDMPEETLNEIMKDLNKARSEAKFDTEMLIDIDDMPRGMKIFKRENRNIGGSIDDQMDNMMGQEQTDMLPDEQMEDEYMNFIIQEALTDEEEDMLLQKLREDEELLMLFDKVVDVAQEFAGSGPVEGPGSGVSDSIPARLSDGEFVFTAKATEQIGADELMRMMKDAEAAADRQGMQEGGLPMMENNPDEDLEESEQEIRNQMMGVNPRYQ